MLKRRNIRVSVMLNIDVTNEELIKRLLFRGKVSGRSDDNMETIKNVFRYMKNVQCLSYNFTTNKVNMSKLTEHLPSKILLIIFAG